MKTMSCIQCGKEVLVDKWRAKTFRFCSYRCGGPWRKQNVPKCPVACQCCGSVFHVDQTRKSVAKYCSPACWRKTLNARGPVVYTCCVCQTQFRNFPCRYARIKTGRIYCSNACRFRGHSEAMRRPRPLKSGTAKAAREWMKLRGMLDHCGRCGYCAHTEILVVHHKDRNRRNNDLDNLEVLCPNCHAIEHYADSPV